MRVVNKTHWNTNDFKDIIKNCVEIDGADQKNLVVEIEEKPYKKTIDAGAGYRYPKHVIQVAIPQVSYMDVLKTKWKTEDVELFTYLILRELAHLRNVRYDEMDYQSMSNLVGDVCDIHKLKVRIKQTKEKPEIDITKERYGKILKRIDEKGRRVKRLQKQLRKLNKTKKYYEKKYKW